MQIANSFEQKIRSQEIVQEKKIQEAQLNEDKKNNDFVQHSRSGMKYYRKLIKSNPLAAQIFSFLSEYMNYTNAVVCSSKVLEEYFEVSRTSIYRAIKFLEDKGFMLIGKSGQTNVYTLNHEIVWSSYRNNKKYCEFDGKILLTESENKDLEIKTKKFKEIMFQENEGSANQMERFAT